MNDCVQRDTSQRRDGWTLLGGRGDPRGLPRPKPLGHDQGGAEASRTGHRQSLLVTFPQAGPGEGSAVGCFNLVAMDSGDDRYDSAHPAVQALLDTPAPELAARRAELQAAADAAGLSPDEIGRILNSRRELPRPLLPEDRATLLALLNYADFNGRDALVEQVDFARVDWYCGCGCATVNLIVDPAAPSARRTYRPIPNEASVVDPNGESIGGVIVFADDGYLSNLEVFWFEHPISPFPPLDQLELFKHR